MTSKQKAFEPSGTTGPADAPSGLCPRGISGHCTKPDGHSGPHIVVQRAGPADAGSHEIALLLNRLRL
jgi:hypothetical protein